MPLAWAPGSVVVKVNVGVRSAVAPVGPPVIVAVGFVASPVKVREAWLLYISAAADALLCVDRGSRRCIPPTRRVDEIEAVGTRTE